MSLARFKADLAEAKQTKYPGIGSLRRGDSDGEFSLTCTHESLQQPVTIQILAPDVSSYPKTSNFMVFTTSEDVEANAAHFVERISAWIQGKTVQQIVAIISDKLSANASFDPASDSDQDGMDDLDRLSDDDDFGSLNSYDQDDDELFQYLRPKALVDAPEDSMAPHRTRRLKKDLTAAKNAGIRVGILPKYYGGNFEFISLSIRISKIGIPSDNLEAWGLKASEYAVLLLRFPHGYPTRQEFLNSAARHPVIHFRFGKCDAAKPSLQTARMAFLDSISKFKDTNNEQRPAELDSHEASFAPLFVSKSINALFNENLPELLSTRLNNNLGWDEAQTFRHMIIESGPLSEDPITLGDILEQGQSAEPVITENTIKSLHKDHARATEEDFSLPLVLVQFALRRLARCTQYCMNCHRKIQGDFEAVKPELCPRELCQFHHLSLGLGVGIEDEIIHNPFVVDLLVSFFYTAVANRKVRALPQGLSLRHYRAGFISVWHDFMRAEASRDAGTITLAPKVDCHLVLKEGDLVVLVRADSKGPAPSGVSNNLSELDMHVCRVLTVHGTECNFQILPQETLLNRLSLQQAMQAQVSPLEPQVTEPMLQEWKGWEGVFLYKYEQEMDNLNPEQHCNLFISMANGIPSVFDMREYLQKHPGRNLSSWDRIHGSSLALLNWIVASNRSLIVQDDAAPSKGLSDATQTPNRVSGMDKQYMQFRFAQGSREKEQLFSKALACEFPRGSEHATRFAWHGSPLHNWHSIIRTGLDFSDTAHGRAYGHGVYFSRTFETSQSYAIATVPGTIWHNSQLRVSEAISICEIVNQPSKFVSFTPHYVVADIHWIQCRYLFVRVDPTAAAENEPSPAPRQRRPGYVKQADGSQVLGPEGKHIQIPVSVIPAGRRPASATGANGIPGSHLYPITDEDLEQYETPGTSDVEDDDIELLPDIDDSFDDSTGSNKRRRRLSDDSSAGTSIPSKLSTPRHQFETSTNESAEVERQPVTLFTPDTLDLDSLPKLPEPTWAASSPGALHRLTRDIRDLQKIQRSTPAATLGWYINFEKLDNVFHWIVELHSFDESLPLAHDMNKAGCTSIVLELRFGSTYPMSPPFVRVIRPRFRPFMQGGGGHITAGGAVCSELLTNSGWSPALSPDKVFLEVRLNLTEPHPPARLEAISRMSDYGVADAVAAYRRAAAAHGWAVSGDLDEIAALGIEV